jgi:hypothetical protein
MQWRKTTTQGRKQGAWCITRLLFSFSWKQSALKIGFKYFTLEKTKSFNPVPMNPKMTANIQPKQVWPGWKSRRNL